MTVSFLSKIFQVSLLQNNRIMNVEAEKLELIEMLLNIDQEEILLKIKEILHQNSSDISLSEEQKQLLDKRLENTI